MIQDICEKFDNHYTKKTPSECDSVICVKDGKVLIHLEDGKITYPTVKEIENVGEYLFSIGETEYFAGTSEIFGGYTYENLRGFRNSGLKKEIFAGITALHIINWYNSNIFCGHCGKKMNHSETERAMVCTCKNTVYPTISPAVIVAVTNKDKICMTKYNRGYAHWALIAGYTEIGESIEETVHREVMEETGLKVKNLRYYKSQPWGLSSSLLFGYFCEVDGSDEIKLDNVELKEGRWFTREEIDFDDDDFSLTREMIGLFRKGKNP